MLAIVGALPVVVVRAVAAVGVVVVVAVVRRGPVVRGRVVAVVLPMVVVMVIVVPVAVVVIMVVIVVVVMVVVVVVVVVSVAMVTTEALAQGQLGGQLSDGLALVQDGLLLPHQALPQVQDGGFGLVGHHAAPAGAAVPVSVGVAARSMGHRGWRVAARVCLRGDRSADKFGAHAVVMFYAGQVARCCCTRQEVVENEGTEGEEGQEEP